MVLSVVSCAFDFRVMVEMHVNKCCLSPIKYNSSVSVSQCVIILEDTNIYQLQSYT
jgi:hypothetical protein